MQIGFHKHQKLIFDDPHPYKVINAGRRFGKTDFCSKAGALEALKNKDSVGYVVAPFAKRAMRLYRKIEKLIPRHYIQNVSEKWMNFELTNGATCWCMSGENPDALPGEGLDWLIIDEAALCKGEVWEVLQPSLLDNPNSKAWIVSSPRGKNWFYDVFNAEKDDPDNFKSFTFTTYDNPYIKKDRIDKLVENMPYLVAQQEIFAKFIEGGLVFRNLHKAMVPTLAPLEGPLPGHNYVMGVDLAKYNDFNVIKVADVKTNTEVFSLRNNNLDWGYQKASIYMQAKRWNNATVVIDRTGVGDAVVEDLMKMNRAWENAPNLGYLTIIPIAFSTHTKPELYKHYILMQENGMIWLLPDEISRKEHEQFECDMLPSGYMRYSAPKGKNDDTVTASALMAWGLDKVWGPGNIMGYYTVDDLDFEKKEKKPIDPTRQIDVEAIIRKQEFEQVHGVKAGMNYGTREDDILPEYREPE